MQRTIPLDDDVYEYLRQQADFRETESAVIRRLLNVPGVSARTNGHKNTNGSALMRLISETGFVVLNPTEKCLWVLSAANKEKTKDFQKILVIRGRHRKYFGLSANDIESSGTSTHPRQIPDTNYWMLTNAETGQKKTILAKALQVLGYSSNEIQAVAKAIF